MINNNYFFSILATLRNSSERNKLSILISSWNQINYIKMKTIKIIVFFAALISFFSCNKEDKEDLNKVSVERYIELLKQGKYDSRDLPDFTYQDIPALLKYRNETQMITGFPYNSVSSYYTEECSLGMYVLWTIEAIRTAAVGHDSSPGKFPSLNPMVGQKGEEYEIKVGSEIQAIISGEYFEWWEGNKDKNFDEFKNIDPLSDTEYRWY